MVIIIMDKVYIVYKDNGEFDCYDYDSWVEYVTTTLEKAKELLTNDGYEEYHDDLNPNLLTFRNTINKDLKAWIKEKELTQVNGKC